MAHFHYYGILFAVKGILLPSVSRSCVSLSFKGCMNNERYLTSYSLLNLVLRSHFCSSPLWANSSCTIYVDFFIFIDFKLSVFYREFDKYWVNNLNGVLKNFRVKAKCNFL